MGKIRSFVCEAFDWILNLGKEVGRATWIISADNFWTKMFLVGRGSIVLSSPLIFSNCDSLIFNIQNRWLAWYSSTLFSTLRKFGGQMVWFNWTWIVLNRAAVTSSAENPYYEIWVEDQPRWAPTHIKTIKIETEANNNQITTTEEKGLIKLDHRIENMRYTKRNKSKYRSKRMLTTKDVNF